MSDHQIINEVYAAKENMRKADDLIRAYLPFIKKEASKYLGRPATEQDDETSISMIAFHEAIKSFTKERGAFLSYAAMIINSRLIDWHRKESRHKGHISLSDDTDEVSLQDTLAAPDDDYSESENLDATKQEIEELRRVMAGFGIDFTDIAENSPKQEKTLEACTKAVRYAAANKELLDELLRSKRLPMAELCEGSGVSRKTLERHRKYILAMLLIQTNGYEIIRGHIKHVLVLKGGAPV